MYYLKHTRCRAAICILGILIWVRLGSKTVFFDGVLSAEACFPCWRVVAFLWTFEVTLESIDK